LVVLAYYKKGKTWLGYISYLWCWMWHKHTYVRIYWNGLEVVEYDQPLFVVYECQKCKKLQLETHYSVVIKGKPSGDGTETKNA